MAKTAERKVEIAQRIKELACDEHGLDPELLIFDLLTFTLTTGDEEWRPARSRRSRASASVKAGAARRQDVAGRLQRLLRRLAAGARGPQLGLPAPLRGGRARPRDGQPEPHHALRRDLRGRARARRRPRLQPPRGRARAASSPTSSPRARRRPRPRRPTRPRAWSPRRPCTSTSCAARRTASEDWIDRSVEKIGAVPTLNDVLLPAMKEVGDKFGAGELILPFVLQSAEVMKRAVAQLENYLDKHRGLHEGHRRHRDGLRRRARHRQVAGQHDPDQQRLHGRRPRQAGPDRRRSSTRPRSTTRPPSA